MLFFADVVVMPLTLCWHSYDNLRVLICYDGPVFMGFLFMVVSIDFDGMYSILKKRHL